MLALIEREIGPGRVLDAFATVSREAFVLPEDAEAAYDDRPLSIGYGQTISQPLIVAMTVNALDLTGGEHVLDVGSGSGYQAAILAEIAADVVAVERLAPLVERSRRVLAALGYGNVAVHEAQDELGWRASAPYDAIAVAAGAPDIPDTLVAQLNDGGRLLIPVGPRSSQELVKVIRSGESHTVQSLGACRFVPLIGSGAWPES